MNKSRSAFSMIFLLVIFGALFLGMPLFWIAALILLAVEGLSYVTVKNGTKNIRARMELGETAEEGRPISGKVEIYGEQNSVLLARASMNIEVENMFTGEVASLPADFHIWPAGKKTFAFRVKDPKFGTVRILTKDIILLDEMSRRECHLFEKPVEDVQIYPYIGALDIEEDMFASYNLETFSYSPVRDGGVKWELSSRESDNLDKIPALSVGNRVLLILDNSSAGDEILSPSERSKLADLYFSFSGALLSSDRPHTLAWIDPDDGIRFRSVSILDDVLQAAGSIGSCGFPDNKGGTVNAVLESALPGAYNTFILVTADSGQNMIPLQQRGAVKIVTI